MLNKSCTINTTLYSILLLAPAIDYYTNTRSKESDSVHTETMVWGESSLWAAQSNYSISSCQLVLLQLFSRHNNN